MEERITTAGILRKEGLYFVAKRQKGGAIGELWEFPGGKNRWGESEEETLQREWEEELNLKITVGKLLCVFDFTNKETLYHLKAYEVYCDNLLPLRMAVHTDYAWVNHKELTTLAFAPSDQSIVRILLA
ncbi:MAG: NUDIX domain-containing protein [Sphaerochaetaceae bacterium]|jgi:mutator protein MutT